MTKKISYFALMICALLMLVACQKKEQTNAAEDSVRLIIEVKDNPSASLDKKVTIKEKQTLLSLLKENAKVVEKNGFITEINGVKQDENANKYWLFKVNDKLADKGANQIKVHSGDKIKFYLGSF